MESETTNSSTQRVEEKVEDVRDIMSDNIATALGRGENIEALLERSKGLEESSHIFHRRAKQARHQMCWQEVKQYIWMLAILVVAVYLVGVAICGNFSLRDC